MPRDLSKETPEQREKRLERMRRYQEENREVLRAKHREYRNANSEKIRERNRRYYEQNRERIIQRTTEYRLANLEQNRLYHLQRNNVHKPDGRVPPELLKRIRVRCLELGGSPGVPRDMRQAIIEISTESPELQDNWLHLDYLAITATRWAGSWQKMKSEARAKFLMAFHAGKLS